MTDLPRGSYVPAAVVARWCGRHPRTVLRWLRRGVIPGTRIGRRWYVRRDVALALRDGTYVQPHQP